MASTLIWMNLGIVIVTAIVFVIMVTKTKAKEDKAFALKQRKKKLNRFARYYNNILVRGRFRRIVEMYASLSCYDSDTVKVESVTLFERNVIVTIIAPIVAAIVMKDVTITILMVTMAMVYYESTVESENDKIYMKLMEEISMNIASVREKYMETDNIPLAVLYSEKSKYLEVPLNNIYRILTDTDGAERLEQFQHSYPVPILKTFANTCSIVNENGAVKHEDGSDSFSEDMQTLRQECDTEIRRLTKTRIAFKSLKQLALAGLVICPACEWYLLTQIPGTAVLLKGFYGLVVHTALMLSTIYVYHWITTVNRPSVVNQIDKIQSIDNLSKNKRVYEHVQKIIPKKYKTISKLEVLIKDSLSSKDLRYIYTCKPVFAAGAFIAALVVLAFGTITIRDSFKNNYNSLSFLPQNVTESQYIQLQRMDDEFLELTWDQYEEYDDPTLLEHVKSRISGISDSDADTQMKRLRSKYEAYHNAVYKWWWWLVAYVAALVAWRIPEFSLKQRKKLVEFEAQNDVSQLQTMMIVLSETKMDVYKAICWLEKQAAVHKAAIRKCHYSYIADPIAALNELEMKSPINDFKRMTRKLKSAVYTLSLNDAFSDMKLDKSQSLAIREMLRNEELEERKNSAKLVAIVPAAIALIGCMVAPILILGVTEITDTLSNLQGFGM